MLQFKYNVPVLPVDDTDEAKDSSQAEDNKSHCKLASLFRLIDVKGWSDSIYDHIATRCTQVPTQFYTNPFGLLFSEITAKKIIKLDFNGNFVQRGSTDYGYNLPGFYLQSAIFKTRPDVNCIIHLHNALLSGISATKQGFLPLSVEGLACADISYYEHQSNCQNMAAMVDEAVKALGPKNHFLVLRNHGIVVCGSSVEETEFFLSLLMHSSKVQLVSTAIVNNVDDLFVLPLTDTSMDREKINEVYSKINAQATDNILWRAGELEYESQMRRLDLLGFKTSYPYKKRFNPIEN